MKTYSSKIRDSKKYIARIFAIIYLYQTHYEHEDVTLKNTCINHHGRYEAFIEISMLVYIMQVATNPLY